jgi:hypothetical protein
VSLTSAFETLFRVLKENFFGGLKELRIAWSFSESDLTV